MRTSKLIVSFLTLLITVSITAQKVKVKKNVILIDKKETPLRVEVKEGIYNFLDSTTGEVFVTADYNLKKIDENTKFEWLVLKNKDSEHENEVDMKYLSFTLNMKKAIAEFLMKEQGFFDVSGAVDNDKIKEYFGEKRERASKEKYKKLVTAANAAAEEYASTAGLGINVDSELKRIFRGSIPYTSSSVDDRIRNADEIENMIGAYRFADPNTIVIRDLDNVKIGTVTQDISGKVTIVSQLLTNPLTYSSRYRFKATDKYATKEFMIEAVRYLHAKDIRLGRDAKKMVAQANQEIRAEAQENYEEAKANSSNIYDQLGYGIDDKGQRFEGKVTMLFEKIKNPNEMGGNIATIGGDNVGNKVKVIYLNEKEKKKIKMLAAKKETRFCVFSADGSETCYQGVRIKSNGMLASGDAISIGGSGAQYLKEVLKSGKVTIYQGIPSNKYFIKTDKQEKAFNFEFGSLIKEEKKIAKLNEYLGCSYGDGTYDEASFQDLENIKELINFYNNSCK
ncbi:hypothetical protein [Aquimarina sp. 2201CG5-10]|uniref:hypothetical protein n=1 Tax=Aquimarina callyspongiae TaxID=3098150 RepID=UPI002AB5D865|nr:hypothetical protein [Aquimarina sp. 2201CG5-10]MDY8138710.1 hypothetical protein [Aquimarina sp. 2201CG5-10]